MLLRRRLLLLFVDILAGVLALGTAVGVVARERDSAQQRERELSVAFERVVELSVAYSDQETGERGYVLTGEAAFLEPYTNGRRAAETLERRVRASVRSEKTAALLGATARAVQRWRAEAAVSEIGLRDSARAAAAAASAAVDSGKGGGRGRCSSIVCGPTWRRSRPSSGPDQQRAVGHLDRVRIALTWCFIASLAVAIIGAVSAAFLIRRWVTRPIDNLGREVRLVRAGALDSPILASGPPELAALALDVDAMRGRIQQQLAESERSRQAVEQSAAVVLTLRSELEPDVGTLPDGWTVAGRLRAAEGVVAGDCYDLFSMKDGHLALVAVDIAGHGATEGILALSAAFRRPALQGGAAQGAGLGSGAG
jgi:CHASE3 domain sensor protein/HAMP domain-containing protein